jgi:uncharacterized damage-inducible protein DinB
MRTEKEDLVAALEAQRRHVLTAIDGLDDEQLRRPVLPSGWSCLGMLKHLALADEHYWFRSIVGGQPLDFFPPEPDADWTIGETDTASGIVALYRHEIAEANAVIASTEPDDPPRQRDPLWDEWGLDFPSLRHIMLHMIGETACHAGHLDAVRELIDGSQWLVL